MIIFLSFATTMLAFVKSSAHKAKKHATAWLHAFFTIGCILCSEVIVHNRFLLNTKVNKHVYNSL